MADNRVWYPNSPIGTVGIIQRMQLAVGYSGITPYNPISTLIVYLRRYLNDPAA